MSLLRWLLSAPRFRSFDDSFARTRNSMIGGLRKAVDNRRESSQTILLVSHFADSFTQLQQALGSWSIGYEIVPSRADEAWLDHACSPAGRRSIQLSLAESLSPDNLRPRQFDESCRIAVMVTERHPLPEKDDRVLRFCRGLPGRSELGYFLSFEDAVIRQVISDGSLQILEMFGMGENELVTSNMISRRLKRVLIRNAQTIGTDFPADSAEEWYALNQPSISPQAIDS